MLVIIMNVCESKNNIFVMKENFQPPFIKLRREELKNEVCKSQESADHQFWLGDRFIPRRFRPESMECNLKYIGMNKEIDILKKDIQLSSAYWRQTSFLSAMNKIFNIHETRLLQFGSTQTDNNRQPTQIRSDSDWRCIPRTKPMAFPNATHEVPEYCMSIDYNLMDWSVNDQKAVSFGKDIIILGDITMIFSVKRPRSLKYSPNGKYLAVGCIDKQVPVLELWKFQSNGEFIVANGKYFPKAVESICCIEWSPDSEEIVCGTNCGLVVALKLSTMTPKYKIEKHNHKITSIRFSPNGRFLATADVNGHIFVYDGNEHKAILRLGVKEGGIAFDWHPWSGAELAISEKSPASIFIINVQRRKVVASYQRNEKSVIINSISFSKITGELLVNINKFDNGISSCKILVLSSLNQVVDILGEKEIGSLFMMWSPDGTKILTFGVDDSFSIWNFYPDNANTKKRTVKTKGHKTSLELYGLIR